MWLKFGVNEEGILICIRPDFSRDVESQQQVTLIAPQFESIPDPWTLELDSLNSTVKTQSLVLVFPTLRLLPPVKEVQQTKRTKTSYQTKSTAKATSTKTKQKTSRPRQKVA